MPSATILKSAKGDLDENLPNKYNILEKAAKRKSSKGRLYKKIYFLKISKKEF